MGKYILKRVLSGLLTLFIILTLVFFMMRIVGGNPVYYMLDADEITTENVERLEKELGLDKPMVVQFGSYLWGILHGDWGKSYFNYQDVFYNMIDCWEPTLMIALLAVVLMVVIGIPLGVIGATHRNSLLDYGITTGTLFFQTIPAFWAGLMLVYLVSFKAKLLPLQSYKYIEEVGFAESLRYVILPAFCLGLSYIGAIARHTRTSFLNVMKEDYIRTAKSKGLPRFKILYKHGLKNCLSFLSSILSNNIAGLLGGSVVVEKVFNIQGIGKLCLDSLTRRDYAQQQACVIACAAIFVVVNILQDIVYKLIDPRVDFTN